VLLAPVESGVERVDVVKDALAHDRVERLVVEFLERERPEVLALRRARVGAEWIVARFGERPSYPTRRPRSRSRARAPEVAAGARVRTR